ncbi:Dip2/Utp12 family-domain-containing protein [Diplogelasinospora grovesii]|uniref:Dip2/Utp12 family-domain-containing protein n=1 Tax=Diplogelasinospora grovesii TaxID=303347 RepID=A0AAN6S1J8_9PEZI|nr:Dip2/Utp12 family-domain-containing protein [Diplogelasinospora grovesii]
MSTKRKPTTLARPVVKESAKPASKTRIDEARTAVSTGQSLKAGVKSSSAPETIEISSDSESSYSFAGEDEEDKSGDERPNPLEEPRTQDPKRIKQSGAAADVDTEMADGPKEGAADEEEEEETSPTFGDLIRGNSTIDVSATLAAQASASVTRPQNSQRSGAVAPVSSSSLGTVLNQALRTDDADLLESCLQVNDATIIQNTINRMDSALAGILLSKLAARMHRRPGRAFGLMKWMQWTLVAHGGSLVTQPDLAQKLGELNRVLEERSRGLSSLLALKGKLDMLDAQMRFRKSLKKAGDQEEESEEEVDVDEPVVVYVEGEEDSKRAKKALTNGTPKRGRGAIDADEDDDFPVNGIDGDDSDDEEDGDFEGDDDDDMEEAEESLDEDEVDHDDVESGEEEDDDEEGESDEGVSAPPAKKRK